MASQLELLRKRFPQSIKGDTFDLSLPLFPTAAGVAAEKTAVADTITEAARHLGCPLVSVDGAARITGHSLRVTGAQGLTRAGLDAWAVQLLGRWGSSTVLQYIQDVPLERSASWAQMAVSRSLAEVVASSEPPATAVIAGSETSLPSASTEGLRRFLPAALEEARASAASLDAPSWLYIESEKGFVHAAPATPPEDGPLCWATSCGWRFSASRATILPSLPEHGGYKVLCAKCFPELRLARKRSLEQAVGGQAGVVSA